MGFTIWKTDELNTNERLIAFYKKELRSSHTIEKGKRKKHYGTKYYRKTISYDFPSNKRYQRMKAIVSNAYRSNKKKYNTLSQLGKLI